jgi:hypothetical protein
MQSTLLFRHRKSKEHILEMQKPENKDNIPDARRRGLTRGGKGERAAARRRWEDVRAQGEDGAIAVFIGAL